jgi:glycosyltransferase involved in cell wall biosynthesis
VEPLTQVLRGWEARLVLLGYPAAASLFPEDVLPKVVPVPWEFSHGYKRWLASAQVIVRPSVDTRFQRAKSDNPVLEAGAVGFSNGGVGVPIVVSETTYGDTMRQAACGDLVARTPEEWVDLLQGLLVSEPARVCYGERLFEYVSRQRLIDQHVKDWYEVYRSVLEKGGAGERGPVLARV